MYLVGGIGNANVLKCNWQQMSRCDDEKRWFKEKKKMKKKKLLSSEWVWVDQKTNLLLLPFEIRYETWRAFISGKRSLQSSFLIKSPLDFIIFCRRAMTVLNEWVSEWEREKRRKEKKILKLMSLNRYTAIVPHHKHKKEITEMFMLLFPLLGDLWQFFFFFFFIFFFFLFLE